MKIKNNTIKMVAFVIIAVSPFLLFKAITGKDPSYHLKDERLERLKTFNAKTEADKEKDSSAEKPKH